MNNPAPTRIYLVRHGETEDADEKRYKGHIDVPLSGSGVDQLKKLADYISAEAGRRESGKVDAVYTSDLSRALKSAEIVAAPFGLEPVVVEGLKERSFGEWEGMTFDEIREKWPDAFHAWADNPLNFSPMHGESTLAVRDRALKAFNDIVEKHAGGTVAIVSHGGITRVILCEMLGIPLENIFRIEQDFAALNVVEIWDYPVVSKMNYVV